VKEYLATKRPDHAAEEIQQRESPDGIVWPVLKRYFTPESLIDEPGGGEILDAGPWSVVARVETG
jgi:hypothetical protein